LRLVDAEGVQFDVPAGESVALCRCGASKTKPFCDRSHREAGFRSCERAG
jgi:CDGSH-type Zn-finger protein